MNYYTAQPSPAPSREPDVKLKGDASYAGIWIGVVLLVLAIALITRARGANGE